MSIIPFNAWRMSYFEMVSIDDRFRGYWNEKNSQWARKIVNRNSDSRNIIKIIFAYSRTIPSGKIDDYMISAEKTDLGWEFYEMKLGMCEDTRWYPVSEKDIDKVVDYLKNLNKDYAEVG